MQKLLILSIISLFVACTNEEILVNTIDRSNENVVYNQNRRSLAEAMGIAQKSIKLFEDGHQDNHKKAKLRTMNLANGVKAIRQAVTRSCNYISGNDTLFYIFNFNNNQGFAIIPASRNSDEIIAVIDSGFYDPEIPTRNPAFEKYMQMARAYVAYQDMKTTETKSREKEELPKSLMLRPVYDTVIYHNIAPKLSVYWGQEGRMGQFCTNDHSGCMNTAAAQIMSYYRYPISLELTYDGRDTDYTTLNWLDMYPNTDVDYNRNSSDIQIGRLARQLGQLAGSTYNSGGGTSTNMNNIHDVLEYLGYDVSSINYYIHTNSDGSKNWDVGYPLAYSLANDKLIFMGGNNGSPNNAHGWVVDGCYYVKAFYRLMGSYDGVNWFVYQELDTKRTCYNHINWGYDGDCNGFFNFDVFNLSMGLSYDMNNPNTQYYDNSYNFYNNMYYFSVWR
jgi:hypothetical protein